jgi:hypothetical protein
VQRREQAQTLAMESSQHEHQCQTEQHLETERQLLHKLAVARDAHKSISDLKEREHDRLHVSLQMAASSIARLQTENRRLQRLLQNRFIDAEDVRRSPSSPDDDDALSANGRHHIAQRETDIERQRDRENSVQKNGSTPTTTSSMSTTNAANAASSHALRSASNETRQIPRDYSEPQGAKPRRVTRDSSSTTTSFNKRLSLGKEGVRAGMQGDVVLVGSGREEDSRTGGMGGRAMDAAAGGGGGVRGEAADERRGRDGERDTVSRVVSEERDESESMHWSSTSSDDRLQDRLSERRAGINFSNVLNYGEFI